jgi:hypothetical protein
MCRVLSAGDGGAMSPLAAALLPGPALLLAGLLLMLTPDAWTVAHLVFLAGTLAMLPAVAALHGLVPAPLRWVATVLATSGALALAGQFLIDFVVATLAGDGPREAMFDRLQASPPLFLICYAVGPALLFIGLAVYGFALPAGWVLVAATLVVGASRLLDQRLLEAAGLALVLLAMAHFSRRLGARGEVRA